MQESREVRIHPATHGLVLIARRSALSKCLDTLQSLAVDSKRKRDRVRVFIKRGDVQSSVTECRDRMRVAKEKFNVRRSRV